MNKKIVTISVLILFSLFLLVGCSKDGEATSKGKSKSIEISIDDGRYILPTKNDGFDPDGDKGIILLDVNVKNKTNETIEIFPEGNMALYDDDQQIDPITVIDSSLDLDFLSNTSIGSDKQKIFPVAFEVEKDKAYELEVHPFFMGEEGVSATVNVNMEDFIDSFDALIEPADIVESFINTVYLGEADDSLEDKLNIDIDEQLDASKKGFMNLLEKISYADVPSKVASEFYDDYLKALQDKAEFDVSLKGHSGEKAIVEVSYSSFTYSDLSNSFSDHRKKYLARSSSYNSDAADEHAFSKLDVIFKDAKAKEARNPLEIHLSKKDDRWEFVEHYDDPLTMLREVFMEGYNF